MDDKYKVSEQAAVLAKRAKEQSEVVQKNTVAAFANMNIMAKSWSSKVAENQNVRMWAGPTHSHRAGTQQLVSCVIDVNTVLHCMTGGHDC